MSVDENGKKYLEGLAGLWCVSLGFSERRLAEAAYRQMLKLPFYHTFAHKATDIGIELAEKLLSIAPVPMSKVFFVNSGSEANDTVVKLVWYYNNAIGRPRKKKIISRTKAYHGVTVASASLTGLANNHRDFDLPIANILHVDCPALLSLRTAGRNRGSVRQPHGRFVGTAHFERRPRHRGGDDCRTDHGRRRRASATRDLLGENPGCFKEIRCPAHCRRSNLRIRPNR